MENIKCVVFDADNTLYSTRSVAKEGDLSAMEVLSRVVGLSKEELYEEFLKIVSTIKDSADPSVRHRTYSYGKLCERYGVDYIPEMYDKFSEAILERIQAVPGVMAVVEGLQGRAILYVLTEDNREMATKKLAKLGFLEKFQRVVTSDDTGIMKPSVKYFGEILAKFEPKEVLVVGDSYEKDLSLPEQLGMKTFLLDSPDKIETLKVLLSS